MYIVTNSTATHLLFKHNARKTNRKTLSTYKYILLKLSTEAWDTQHYYPATDHLNDRKPALHCKPRQRGTARTAIHPRLLRDKQLLNCQIMTQNLFNDPPDHNLVQERLTAKIAIIQHGLLVKISEQSLQREAGHSAVAVAQYEI